MFTKIRFQRYSSHHITGHDVTRAIKRITNATMASKETMASKPLEQQLLGVSP
jgi:hypothetical protein